MQIEMTEGQTGNVIMALGEVPSLRDQLADALRELEEAERRAREEAKKGISAEFMLTSCEQTRDSTRALFATREDYPASNCRVNIDDRIIYYLARLDSRTQEMADITALLRKRKDYPSTLEGTVLMFKVKHFLKELDKLKKQLKKKKGKA